MYALHEKYVPGMILQCLSPKTLHTTLFTYNDKETPSINIDNHNRWSLGQSRSKGSKRIQTEGMLFSRPVQLIYSLRQMMQTNLLSATIKQKKTKKVLFSTDLFSNIDKKISRRSKHSKQQYFRREGNTHSKSSRKISGRSLAGYNTVLSSNLMNIWASNEAKPSPPKHIPGIWHMWRMSDRASTQKKQMQNKTNKVCWFFYCAWFTPKTGLP